MEHVDGSHPLRVTLGQIVIHSYYMNTITGKGIQEYRKRSGKGLTFTCEHLGNLTLMQYGTSEELYIKVYHIPQKVITTSYPMVMVDGLIALYLYKIMSSSQLTVEVVSRYLYNTVLSVSQTIGSTLNDGEHLGTSLIQGFLQNLQHILLQLVNLMEDRSTVLNICIRNTILQFLNLCAQVAGRILNTLLYLLRTGTQLIVAESLNLRINIQHALYKRAISLEVARLLVAKNLN